MQNLILLILALIGTRQAFTVNQLNAIPKNAYPIRAGFIEKVQEYYPVDRLAASLGVPGYTDQKIYNYLLLGFWKCSEMPTGAVLVWSKPVDHFGDDSVFGKTKTEIQQNLRQKYNDNKSHIMVSAFGPRQNPASLGLSPLQCAQKLATFVLDNNLDGCDINWQDQRSLLYNGSDWIITFHGHLRSLLPTQIVTHSASAAYFRSQDYNFHSYTEINAKINKTVNFYNIQYFNLGLSKFNTYEELFIESTGAFSHISVKEIEARGVDRNKIVVLKPAVPSDTTGSGFMDYGAISQALEKAYSASKWYAGLAIWQYASDVRGKGMSTSISVLKQLCTTNKDCK